MGQLKEAVHVMTHGRLGLVAGERRKAGEHAAEALAAAQVTIEKLSQSIYNPGVVSISDRDISDNFRIAYDIQQTIRYGVYLYRCASDPEYAASRRSFVDSSPVMRYSQYERELPGFKAVPKEEPS